MPTAGSHTLPGLTATLDKLVRHHGGAALPEGKPHAFVYFVTISNASGRAVTLLGRKWIIDYADGMHDILEGEKIVGETPSLRPGEQFSYNSFHVIAASARATGSFHGIDDRGKKFHVILAPFDMSVP